MSKPRFLLSTLIIAIVSCGPVWAQSSTFDRMDKDDDSRLDRDEFGRIIIDRFDCRDENEDGSWARQECRGANEDALNAADINDDNRISKDELTSYRNRQFDKLDRNRDGFLGAPEYREWGLSDM